MDKKLRGLFISVAKGYYLLLLLLLFLFFFFLFLFLESNKVMISHKAGLGISISYGGCISIVDDS